MQINFSNLSEGLARTYGDADCIVNVERNRRYSFRSFHRLTNRIANMLQARLDLGHGDVWLCMLFNDSLSLLSQFTAFKGASCACYTNATDTLEVQAVQLDLVAPKVVFIEAALLPTHHALLKARGLCIVCMDPPGPDYPDVLDFWQLLDGVGDANPDVLHDDRSDCLYLRFTGGTTGAPKAVMYCIDNWLATRDLHNGMDDEIPVGAARLLHFGMISHASGMVLPPILFKGGCNLTMNDRSLQTWCDAVERERVTATVLVPAMLYRLLEAPEAQDADLSSLQTIYYGASPMLPIRLQQLIARFGNIFVQLYGSSEHASVATVLSKRMHLADSQGSLAHLSSAGRLAPGVELLIVDPQGQRVAEGCDGEVWLRSRAICMGYLHAPEKTAAEFQHGFWKSGDYGRIDAQGFVYILDRVKDTVLCHGNPVYPSLVEAALSTHPQVLMAAVVGVADSRCGEAVHAEVVLRPGQSLDSAELLRHLQGRVPAHCMPQTLRFTDALPMSAVGKVLRRSVREACQKIASPAAAATAEVPT